MTVDIISEYAFGEGFGMLDSAKDNRFKPEFLGAFDLVLENVINFTYFPLMRIMSNSMPSSIAAKLDKKISNWLVSGDIFETCNRDVADYRLIRRARSNNATSLASGMHRGHEGLIARR